MGTIQCVKLKDSYVMHMGFWSEINKAPILCMGFVIPDGMKYIVMRFHCKAYLSSVIMLHFPWISLHILKYWSEFLFCLISVVSNLRLEGHKKNMGHIKFLLKHVSNYYKW